MTNLKKLLALSIMFLAIVSPVFADETSKEQTEQEITAQDLGIDEPTLLPDSPFYFFKNTWRKVRETFTFNPIKKIELKEKFSGERLIELKKLAEKNAKPELLKKATDYYNKENEQIRARIENIKQKASESSEVNKFMEKFIHQRILHQQILEKIEEKVPENVKQKISEQREQHLEYFKDIMLKLENKENIPERLESAIDELKGNDIQNIKNVEILEEIGEKMPEGVKQQLRNTHQRILEKMEK